MNNSREKIARFVRKFCVSAFVVFSFAAYAIHDRTTNPDVALAAPQATAAPATSNISTAVPPRNQQPPGRPTRQAPGQNQPAQPTQAVPTQVPASAQTSGQYKDGTYTGPSTNAFFGQVQIQATIQNGKLTDVQFLDYPHDRRTSQRINQVAAPRLVQEAIQAQSANVNIISGATLTSRAFMQSLSSVLSSARA